MSEMTEMKKGNGKMGNGSWATEKLGDEKWAGRKKTTQSTVSVRNIPAAQLSVVVFFSCPFYLCRFCRDSFNKHLTEPIGAGKSRFLGFRFLLF